MTTTLKTQQEQLLKLLNGLVYYFNPANPHHVVPNKLYSSKVLMYSDAECTTKLGNLLITSSFNNLDPNNPLANRSIWLVFDEEKYCETTITIQSLERVEGIHFEGDSETTTGSTDLKWSALGIISIGILAGQYLTINMEKSSSSDIIKATIKVLENNKGSNIKIVVKVKK